MFAYLSCLFSIRKHDIRDAFGASALRQYKCAVHKVRQVFINAKDISAETLQGGNVDNFVQCHVGVEQQRGERCGDL